MFLDIIVSFQWNTGLETHLGKPNKMAKRSFTQYKRKPLGGSSEKVNRTLYGMNNVNLKMLS
jgi:hypothetical protein